MTSRDRNGRDLERRLRDERPRPSDALVHAVANLLDERPRRRVVRPRLAFAAALTFALLTSATALGGINGVASSARNAVSAVSKTVNNNGKGNPPATTPAATPTASANANANANAGKTDICHSTGSASNPYVLISVSSNSLDGHSGHGGDIIPAPPTGCPPPSPADDQYKPGKGCGDKNHVHFKEGQCKK